MMTFIRATPHDPLVARDGRPFGAGQGNRMRGLPWLLPSVVAGAFRTALVKSKAGLDFSWRQFTQEDLLNIEVAGVFPVHGPELYLPAPNDAVAEPAEDAKAIQSIHRLQPRDDYDGGCDFPDDLPLLPVMLPRDVPDVKPAETPAWWPVCKYAEWLVQPKDNYSPDWFDSTFLQQPRASYRDHVCLDAARGAAAEGQLFTTVGLNLTHLPRYRVDESTPWRERLAKITLSGRISIPDSETALTIDRQFGGWRSLGGERRMIHLQSEAAEITGWTCPADVRSALASATNIRMILATPAIFTGGWKPGWLTNRLEGELSGVKLKLVGVCNGRWRAVSGWSMQPHKETGRPGPKPIRRMAPAGSVYFFQVEKPGAAAPLADLWLKPVSDEEQERRDGFGLAAWGVW